MTTREHVWRTVRSMQPVKTKGVAMMCWIDSRKASAILHQLMRSKLWPVEKVVVGKCGQNNGTTWRTK